MPKKFLSIALPCVCILAACASEPSPPAAQCHATGARDLLGKTVDERVLSDARAEATALRSRVIPYGAAPPTSDIDPMRLNVEVVTEADGSQHIKRLRCG